MGDVDYTQVQREPCPVCGHDVASVPPSDLAPALIEAARRWTEFIAAVLDHPDGVRDLRVRPSDDVWSAVEYACHVRDVLSVFARRVETTLLTTDPEYGWWDHEAAVDDDHYAEQDPVAVADDITEGATELAHLVRRLGPAELTRTGTRLGVAFDVVGLIRFALHEAVHHLADARHVIPDP